MITVAENTVVAFRYTMKNGKGALLEDKMKSDPVSYLQGASVIQPSLQQQMEGLKTGDKKSIYLFSTSGLTTDDFIFDVIIDNVRAATEEEKLLGYPIHLTTELCESNCDCYEQD